MHECPFCYEACFCNGDIDDIDTGEAPEDCKHYRVCILENGGESEEYANYREALFETLQNDYERTAHYLAGLLMGALPGCDDPNRATHKIAIAMIREDDDGDRYLWNSYCAATGDPMGHSGASWSMALHYAWSLINGK